jgi:hypothetical protein
VRRHDCALERGDMSPRSKAVTCHRTPKSPPLEKNGMSPIPAACSIFIF